MGQLDVAVLSAVFIVAAILGDAVNYAVGSKLGQAAVSRGMVSKDHIARTEKFYAKYGGKTVVLARFVPIVRTFAPFVAGIGSMPYGKFAAYNVGGALLWTFLFVGAGFFFGNLPFVRHNFTLVVLGIVAVSVLPVAYELWAAAKEARAEKEAGGGAAAGGSPA
ncbi:Protein DedA [Tetrabaena socialis]|uniref:Protein DedA n=1 Tax=Tetrabaena socialis TaxID=47790 RepID=A0A2J8AHL5_9CHLO|nr:Protein DedA [Tetrabaena socialis]|eukprot:PNH12013.1 Protein DedA [Tetrabaena socialis]